MDATNRVRFCGGGPGKHTWSGRAWNSAPWRRGGPIHPPTGPSLNHGGAPFFLGGGAARWRRGAAWCPPPPPVMGSVAHFWGGGQQAAMCPPPQTAMGSGAHVWGGGQHPIAPTSSTPSVSLVSVHDSGGRRDAALYFSEDGNAGAVVPLDTLVTPTREPTGGGSPGASGESGDHSRRVTALEATVKEAEERAEAAAVTAGELLTRIVNAEAAVKACRDQLRAATHARWRAAGRQHGRPGETSGAHSVGSSAAPPGGEGAPSVAVASAPSGTASRPAVVVAPGGRAAGSSWQTTEKKARRDSARHAAQRRTAAKTKKAEAAAAAQAESQAEARRGALLKAAEAEAAQVVAAARAEAKAVRAEAAQVLAVARAEAEALRRQAQQTAQQTAQQPAMQPAQQGASAGPAEVHVATRTRDYSLEPKAPAEAGNGAASPEAAAAGRRA